MLLEADQSTQSTPAVWARMGPYSALNANFKCKATGDFRKAMCEYTWVVQSDQPCFLAAAGALPNRNPNHNTGIVKCQFMLDQFDADTGKVDELMCDVECCGFDGCSPYPWPLVTAQWNQVQPLVEPSLQQVPQNVIAFGPQLLVNLSMEAGKSNNHVKAIKVKQRPMVTEAGQEYIPDRVEPFSPDHYLRRTAGGFKEL